MIALKIIDLESTAENIQLFDFEPSCHLKKATFLPTDSVTMATVKPEETADPESVQPAYQQVSNKQNLFVCLFTFVYSGLKEMCILMTRLVRSVSSIKT